MELAGKTAKDVLRGLLRQSQASTQASEIKTMDWEAMEAESRRKQALARRAMQADDLGGLRALEAYTAEKFNKTEKNRVAFEAAVTFDPLKENFYLWGPVGCGKSHLAAMAARRFIEQPRAVSTITQMQLARLVRAADGADREQDIIDTYARKQVLVIDDLGVAKDTEFNLSLLYEIIQTRYMNTPGGLIVTSNLSLDQLAQKLGEDRIPSRLEHMGRLFSLVGEKDYRLEKRPK